MKKAAYRKFRIRTVQGSDDFAAIKEVVYRRYKRTLEEDQSLPDLVLIDGGKGQLSAAHQALSELGLESLPLASIAKEEEILFVHGYPDQPVLLERSSPVLHLIQRIRDEAHRFAVGFHRKRRTARDFASALLDIPGIGKKTQARLLQAFGSLKRIREADFEALSRIVGPSLAEVIKKYLIQ
jgi:excinuclease ABC subunit C